MTAKTVTGRVTGIKRHGHTYYGNPMMSVQLDGGEWYRISDNAGIVYGIENPEYRDAPHVFELTRAGRLSGRCWSVSEYLATTDGADAEARRIHNERISGR